VASHKETMKKEAKIGAKRKDERFAKRYGSMKCGQEIGSSSQGRSLKKLCRNKVMQKGKNSSSGSHGRGRSLDRLLNFGLDRFRGRVLQRGNRLRLLDHGR